LLLNLGDAVLLELSAIQSFYTELSPLRDHDIYHIIQEQRTLYLLS